MKSKLYIKILLFIFTLIFLWLTIFSIQSTYARYITSLTASSTVELGRWLILVNNQNVLEGSDISEFVFPEYSANLDYIAEDKIVPTSAGSVQITIDHTKVTVPFKYELSFSTESILADPNDPDTPPDLTDFKMTSYSINGVETETTGNTVITQTILPTQANKVETLILNFAWLDDEDDETLEFDDIEDTAFSRKVSDLGLRFNLTCTQLRPTP